MTLGLACCCCRLIFGVSLGACPEAIVADSEGIRALRESCLDCHEGPKAKADLDLALLLGRALDVGGSLRPSGDDARTLRQMLGRIRRGEMPPASETPLTREAREAIALVIDSGAAASAQEPPPAVRRLNRQEIARSLRDVFFLDAQRVNALPDDEVGEGFDTLADLAVVNELVVERLLEIGEEVAERSVALEGAESGAVQTFGAQELILTRSARRGGSIVSMHSAGSVQANFIAGGAGEYRLRVRACGQQAGADPVRLRSTIDGKVPRTFDVPGGPDSPQWFDSVVALDTAGSHVAEFEFINDYYSPKDPKPSNRDRNAIVWQVEIVGPLGPPVPTEFERFLQRNGAMANGRIEVSAATALTLRALWRRDPSAETCELLLRDARGACGDAATPARTLRYVITAGIVSPNFALRSEADAAHPDGYDLATRLSYFLWSSCPDDELLDAAEEGTLLTEEGYLQQVERMMLDPRASALSERFVAQWLQVDRLRGMQPDPARFPTVNGQLVQSMLAQTNLYVDAIVREGRSVWELLESNFTFVDGPLARHYGMEWRGDEPMQRVAISAAASGVLRHASVLTATSHPTRTSPVRRGKWILEALLDRPPPPPPPGVGVLGENEASASAASVREMLALHRSKSDCAVCHDALDGMGLALEGLDAVGRVRTVDGGSAIDESGTLPDGSVILGTEGVRQLLIGERSFIRGLVRKLMVYSLGRGTNDGDESSIELMVDSLGEAPTLRAIVVKVAQVPVFRGLPSRSLQ
ncbi:MAG: DUF1592 domain-containing protein [Phycisphaerales bacterium]|nr:DUF1592 domain-containing protein [Phycisphaerales bacterium]